MDKENAAKMHSEFKDLLNSGLFSLLGQAKDFDFSTILKHNQALKPASPSWSERQPLPEAPEKERPEDWG
jgi:hypothetical protein